MKVPKFKVTPVASTIPFDNNGKKFNSIDAQSAIEEIRSNTVYQSEILTSSLNGNHNIQVQDANIHIVRGTATGYSITLPDATQLFIGRRFELLNESDETIILKDNAGNILRELIADEVATITLEPNGNNTNAGSWIITTVSGSATGIVSYVVTNDIIFSTSSTTDVIISSFSTTPVQGRYSVSFSSEIQISQQNKIAQCVIDVGGTPVENTRRLSQGVGNNFQTNITTIGEVTVNGSQAVQVRVNISSGSLEVKQRSLILIRLGN